MYAIIAMKQHVSQEIYTGSYVEGYESNLLFENVLHAD